MAAYRCSRCGELKNGDYNVCTEDPNEEFGLICEDCSTEIEDEYNED